MNKMSHSSLPVVFALALGLGGGTAFAMGSNPQDSVDQSSTGYQCATLSESTGATQKSPQRQVTRHCIDTRESPPIAIDFWIDTRTVLPRGATAAKAPSRTTVPIASPIATDFQIRTN